MLLFPHSLYWLELELHSVQLPLDLLACLFIESQLGGTKGFLGTQFGGKVVE